MYILLIILLIFLSLIIIYIILNNNTLIKTCIKGQLSYPESKEYFQSQPKCVGFGTYIQGSSPSSQYVITENTCNDLSGSVSTIMNNPTPIINHISM